MRFSKLASALILSVVSVLAVQSEAEAHGRRYYYRYYYPGFAYWGGYYAHPFYYGGFYGPPYPYARVYYGFPDRAPAELRIEVKPVEAEVYVDSYLAGIVDEFDGFFQRLRLSPGAHEIVIYLDGYRTIREKLYLGPGASYKLRRAMEPLAEGETTEPRPEPPPEPKTTAESEPESERAITVAGFGALELRVQPEGAEILIDSDPWPSSGAGEPLLIHLPAGEHRIEIRSAGHTAFATSVQVDPGKTTTLNVKLPKSN